MKYKFSNMSFASLVFLTIADMAQLQSLSPAEQFEMIERDEEAGFQSGIAPRESLSDRLARVRSL